MNTKPNPADYDSKGLISSELQKLNCIEPPEFLWKDEDAWPVNIQEQKNNMRRRS